MLETLSKSFDNCLAFLVSLEKISSEEAQSLIQTQLLFQ